MIKLLHLLLPSTQLPKTYSTVKQVLRQKSEIKVVKYCRSCDNVVDGKFCQNNTCVEYNNKRSNFNTLTSCKLHKQIENIIKKYYDAYLISSLINSQSDITKSRFYKKLNPQQQNNSLNLMIRTDGVPLVNSSGLEAWPVFCSILEFPKKLRNSIFNSLISSNCNVL